MRDPIDLDAVRDDKLWLCCQGRDATVGDCLDACRRVDNPNCPMSPAIVRATAHYLQPSPSVERLRETYNVPVVRVSQLVYCPRKAWYTHHMHTAPRETPRQLWARTRGSLIHDALERFAHPAEITERRLHYRFTEEDHGLGFVLAGQFDVYDGETLVLRDWKTSNASKDYFRRMRLPKDSHTQQLRYYLWLLAHSDLDVPETIRVQYIAMHGQRAATMNVPVLTDEKLRRMETEIVQQADAVLYDDPPPPAPAYDFECRFCRWTQCPSNRR